MDKPMNSILLNVMLFMLSPSLFARIAATAGRLRRVSPVLLPEMLPLIEKFEGIVNFLFYIRIVRNFIQNILEKSLICCKFFK